jgi:hypothetical protein
MSIMGGEEIQEAAGMYMFMYMYAYIHEYLCINIYICMWSMESLMYRRWGDTRGCRYLHVYVYVHVCIYI